MIELCFKFEFFLRLLIEFVGNALLLTLQKTVLFFNFIDVLQFNLCIVIAELKKLYLPTRIGSLR
jgi:hypothetical protein